MDTNSPFLADIKLKIMHDAENNGFHQIIGQLLERQTLTAIHTNLEPNNT